jgi:protocatechuate 3,4-dioxygenase beta subunit
MKALSLLLISILASLLLTIPASAITPFTVSGHVTDAEGTPIPGAQVFLLDADNLPIFMTYTDQNGSFVFEN